MKNTKKKILLLVLALLLTFTIAACKKKTNTAPTLSGVANTSTPFGIEFDAKKGVTAYDKEDGDLTSEIEVTGAVNHMEAGNYTLNYSVKDSKGLEATAERVVTVLEQEDAPLANGWFNYKFATADTRHTFFAAAERWLLENAYAGIPLAAQSGLTMQHARIVLPVEEYIPSFGWGTNYATITQDDVEVATENGGTLDLLQTPAVAGEKTYRTWMQQEPETLNYWLGKSTTESDYGSFINGSFYAMALNQTANGWEYVPELASGDPIPINPVIVNGKVTARKWEVPLRNNLVWAYNTGTDTSGFASGHDKLDAHDYEYTYRLALDNEWFRAISGGGDFVTSKIKGAEAYTTAVAEGASQSQLDALWADFGIHASSDGLKLVVEYTEAKSMFDIKYGFGWPAIHQDIYEANPDLYGTSPEYIASSGLYTITYWEDGVGSRYKKVNTHPLAAKISWTGETIKIITGTSAQDQAFEAFENGLLESAGVPNSRVDEFKDDPRVLRTPGASVWSLNINMVGSVQAQQAQWPGSEYVPKQILGNKDFRLALYFSLNRDQMTQYDSKTYPTGMKISAAYYVDPEGGIPYRSTPQGMAVGENLAYSTNGYDQEAAQALFKRAVQDEIAAGHLQKGTAENYTEINLEVLTFDADSGSAIADNWIAFAKDGFETLIDEENFVKVVITPKHTPGSQIYDLIEEGSYDLALSSISGNTLDAASFLDIFITDNRSGFLLNYGYDSSVPEIEVEWTEDGEDHRAIFSFDAIYELLNGKVFLKDGNKISEYGSVNDIVDVYVQGNEFTELERDFDAGDVLLEIFGPTAEELDEDVDLVEGVVVIVKDEDDNESRFLLMITKTGNIYELFKVIKVDYEDTEEAVLNKAVEDLEFDTKTAVDEDELEEFAAWFEYDVDAYETLIGYYFDNEDGTTLLIIGEAGGLFFFVGLEDLGEMIEYTPENVEAFVADLYEDDVFNVRDVTHDDEPYVVIGGWYGLKSFEELAAGFGVSEDWLKVYAFDIDENGTIDEDEPYYALFVVNGFIMDYFVF